LAEQVDAFDDRVAAGQVDAVEVLHPVFRQHAADEGLHDLREAMVEVGSVHGGRFRFGRRRRSAGSAESRDCGA